MKFKIEIVARGEGLIYQDNELIINFSCGFNRNTHKFDIDVFEYSDSKFIKFKLPPEKEIQVLQNIATFFKRKNEQVNFVRTKHDVILKTTEELLDERLNRQNDIN